MLSMIRCPWEYRTKCVILRQADAANFPANPAHPKDLAFYQFALKAVHLTPTAGVGGLDCDMKLLE